MYARLSCWLQLQGLGVPSSRSLPYLYTRRNTTVRQAKVLRDHIRVQRAGARKRATRRREARAEEIHAAAAAIQLQRAQALGAAQRASGSKGVGAGAAPGREAIPARATPEDREEVRRELHGGEAQLRDRGRRRPEDPLQMFRGGDVRDEELPQRGHAPETPGGAQNGGSTTPVAPACLGVLEFRARDREATSWEKGGRSQGGGPPVAPRIHKGPPAVLGKERRGRFRAKRHGSDVQWHLLERSSAPPALAVSFQRTVIPILVHEIEEYRCPETGWERAMSPAAAHGTEDPWSFLDAGKPVGSGERR
ncbi:hypothetical protein B0H14DRAFT_3129715 [Mycena olivaceomarginata]|nr:hypothetical protein B0H14DRAFT_3129715 [Mycena olivaceomarginata]